MSAITTVPSYMISLFPVETMTADELAPIAGRINKELGGDFLVEIIADLVVVCEHCGQPWATDELGCPVCCNEAKVEFDCLNNN
jgi:hypothetical protein